MKCRTNIVVKNIKNIKDPNDLLKCPICHGYIHCSLYVDQCRFTAQCKDCRVNGKHRCLCNVLRYVKEIESLRGAIYDKEW